MAKQVALVVLGAILIVGFVVIWKYATDALTLFVESFWCTTIDKEQVCRLRGYQHFLIWTAIGIINLLIVGWLLSHFADRPRRS
jgi:hypothetical protein